MASISWVTATVLLVVLIVAVIIVVVIRNKQEHFSDLGQSGIVFWDKKETYKFIMDDIDGYFESMSNIQLQQRMNVADQVATDLKKSYKERSARVAVSFSEEEKAALRSAAREVDSLVVQRGVPKEKLMRVPWIFALTEGNTYEDGIPHVRGSGRNVYMLSTNTTLQETHNMCQLSMTLFYLRMTTLFPNQDSKHTRSLHLEDTAFPKSWGLPSCGGPQL